MWRSDGVTGYDLTFSALKSVSALWALGSDDIAAAALAAHQAAGTAGLAYLEAHAALSRKGTDGVEQIGTDGLAVALFDHRTSRAGDPQLHTHALVLNKARCADGVWRTLFGTELFGHKKTAGMIYQNALRNEMNSRLGVEFGPVSDNGQAEIVGQNPLGRRDSTLSVARMCHTLGCRAGTGGHEQRLVLQGVCAPGADICRSKYRPGQGSSPVTPTPTASAVDAAVAEE